MAEKKRKKKKRTRKKKRRKMEFNSALRRRQFGTVLISIGQTRVMGWDDLQFTHLFTYFIHSLIYSFTHQMYSTLHIYTYIALLYISLCLCLYLSLSIFTLPLLHSIHIQDKNPPLPLQNTSWPIRPHRTLQILQLLAALLDSTGTHHLHLYNNLFPSEIKSETSWRTVLLKSAALLPRIATTSTASSYRPYKQT